MPETSRRAYAPQPASKNALSVVLLTQGFRYWLLSAWAFALVMAVGWRIGLAWLVAAAIYGSLRARLDQQMAADEGYGVGRRMTLVAAGSSVIWAAAPAMVYASPVPWSLAVTACLIVCGYLLVVTQFRTMPARAALASAPYSLLTLWLGYTVWGQGAFWPYLTCVGVVISAMFFNVVFGYYDRIQNVKFESEQARLIGELEVARDSANAASEAKSAFLAMISHELRTPMNGVLGAVQLLDATKLEPAQQTYVGMIRNSGGSLLGLLNDVLDFTKIEAGRLELELVETSLRDLAQRVGEIWAVQAQAKGLDFEIAVDPAAPGLVLADPTRLTQILHNLLSNAVKFTAQGGVRLSVDAHKLADDRAALSIAVSDTGPGISAEDQAKLFQPFAQLDISSTRRFGGTGLGLAICRRLTELMEGDLTVGTRAGGGSVFTLSLQAPVVAWAPDAVCDAEGAAAADIPHAPPLRVLVVEDHPMNRKLLGIWLDSQGHHHTCAENGQIAVEVCASQLFDVVLMDVNMPVLDGLGAVRALRAQEGPNRDVPIVMVSASARPEDHAAGFEAGADAYLNKPIDFSALGVLMAQCDMREAQAA